MKAPLELRVTRFESDVSWDWRLSDGQGRFLADCEARLAAEPRWLEALRNLPAYLERRRGAFAVEHDLAELGEWLGKAAFGPVAAELARRRRGPATVVRVVLPPEALPLVSFPLELAHLGEPGKPLALAGVRLVYELDDGGPTAAGETRPIEGALRVLAVFSLPHGENPLNLRADSLGKTLSPLAELADKEDSPAEAVGFSRLALRYAYAVADAEDCAGNHSNLAAYTDRTGSPAEDVASHDLAAAMIRFQTGSGALAESISNLARSALPESPPSFEEVAARVEEIEGVRFLARSQCRRRDQARISRRQAMVEGSGSGHSHATSIQKPGRTVESSRPWWRVATP